MRFKFAPIQSCEAKSLALRLGIDVDNPSTHALILNGRAYLRSDAVLQILSHLPGWRWTRVFLAVPHHPRDWIYDRIALNRYRIFGRRRACEMPDTSLMRHQDFSSVVRASAHRFPATPPLQNK